MCAHTRAPHFCRRALFSILILANLLLFLFAAPRIFAQSSTPDAQRRIKVAVKPEYSDLAKRLSLTGIVRVEVQIAPDGKVKKAHVVGGHPVLALDAEKAAMLTEFEPGPKDTAQIIEFHIGPKS